MSKQHHVFVNKNGGGDVKTTKTGRCIFHTRIKSQAIKKARILSRRQKTNLVVHNTKGKVVIKNRHKIVRNPRSGRPRSKRNRRR